MFARLNLCTVFLARQAVCTFAKNVPILCEVGITLKRYKNAKCTGLLIAKRPIADECDALLCHILPANVEEVQHGKWIIHKNSDGNLNHYECSVCHRPQGYPANWCEDCGARMDGKGE